VLAKLLIRLMIAGVTLPFAASEPALSKTLDGDAHQVGPVQSRSIYWVGHSLVEGKAPIDGEDMNLMTLLARFVAARGQAYTAGDHTRWGSSLAALWRGSPHSYRFDPAAGMEMVRQRFESEASRYDALVATEVLPLRPALRAEFSSFYLRRFACALLNANPSARIYLYETWVPLNGGEKGGPSYSRAQWRQDMLEQRRDWEQLADEAMRARVRSPGWLSRIGLSTGDGGCPDVGRIYTVPVGRAFLALADRLAGPTLDEFRRPDGARLTVEDLYLNPYVAAPTATGGAAAPRDPTRPVDDIHMGSVGLYLSALVHYATLYRQSPVGLPPLAAIGPEASHALQCLAWETVLSLPTTGVSGTAVCRNMTK